MAKAMRPSGLPLGALTVATTAFTFGLSVPDSSEITEAQHQK